MAQFTANFVKVYDASTGSERIASGNPQFFTGTYTLSDGEENTTFERDIPTDAGLAGDPIETTGISLADASYRGQFNVVVNGTSHPVIVIQIFGGDLFVFGNIPGITDADLPDDIITGFPPTPIFNDAPFETGVICFAAGTLIATPTGDVAVEELTIGDLVLTADGRAVPVKWLGRQSLAPLFQRVRLVRVAAGVLGDGLPARDLVVTADHALMIDGLLINAGALVNGRTITQETDLPERVIVYHIETEGHEVILAEGAQSETYIDYANRQAFDNYAEYLSLYGEDRMIAENPAPRISSARHLPAALRARLGADRAA